MSAVQRRRKAYSQRRKQKRSRKILSRRRRLHSRRKKKARTRRIVKYARSHYQKRRQSMSRYFDRRMRANVLSAHKAKHTMCSQRSKAYSRKPSQVGRLKKKKQHFTRTRSGLLHAKLKKRAAIKAKLKKALREHARRRGTSALKKVQRKPRRTENDIFYSLANPSMSKAASPSEDRQTKKQSVRFTTPGNSKNKEMEQQEDLSTDNQSSQQTVTSKKRGRHAGTSVCKSR